MRLSLIVAKARNGCIGKDNQLPWRLPGDLRHFRRVTLGKPVIMGRRTWESLGKPLPDRTNIVVSGRKDTRAPGARLCGSFKEALELAEKVCHETAVDEAVIIGGALLYAEALPLVSRLYVTEISAEIAGDAFFPACDKRQFREISREDRPANLQDEYPYSLVVYERL